MKSSLLSKLEALQAICHGCRKWGGQAPPPQFLGLGGTGGTKKWYTSTCRLLIICDIMNIESSKIMLSEVRQLLHITLAIPVTSATAAQNEHFLP